MKKLVSLILVAVMVLALGVTAFAANANTHTITITNTAKNDHEYTAYQVFAGDLADGKLTNIVWGSGVDGDALLAALQADDLFGEDNENAFAECETAEDVANVLGGLKNNADQVAEFANKVNENLSAVTAGVSTRDGDNYTIPVVGDGYYFIKDTGDIDVTIDSETKYILQVVDDVEVVAKSGTVEVDKTVATGGYACGKTEGEGATEENPEGHKHSIAACGLEYADTNSAKLGDVVAYKIESEVPASAAEYDYYYFIMNDTLSEGLTFDPESVIVKIDGEAATAGEDYTMRTASTDPAASEGKTFEIALIDAVGNAGKEVVVTYEATVNENALIGVGGNTNDVTVKFSTKPNEDHDGSETGFPDEEKTKPEGETPVDETVTYVAALKLLKVDGNDKTKTLEGAEFRLAGKSTSVIVKSKEVYTEDAANGTYYELNDGSYTTTVPQDEHMDLKTTDRNGGYVIAGQGERVDKTVGGVGYRIATNAEMAGTVDLYKYVASNKDQYKDTETKYTKTIDNTKQCTEESVVITDTTGSDGIIDFGQMNAGEYTLTELASPTGYNLLKAPIEFEITCVLPETAFGTTGATNECTWAIVSESAAGKIVTDEEGNWWIQITVENLSGAELPETGGIGTTIFYALGSVLLLGAAVLLITKKRMSAHN